jgi:tetratricopeptide (TPR) repeat protein
MSNSENSFTDLVWKVAKRMVDNNNFTSAVQLITCIDSLADTDFHNSMEELFSTEWLNKDNMLNEIGLFYALCVVGLYDKAIEMTLYMLDTNQTSALNSHLYVRLSQIEDIRGDREAAISYLEKARQYQNDDTAEEVLVALARHKILAGPEVRKWNRLIKNDGGSAYNRACVRSVRNKDGDTDKALRLLRQDLMSDHGRLFRWWRIDPDLENVRQHPAFQELCQEIERYWVFMTAGWLTGIEDKRTF